MTIILKGLAVAFAATCIWLAVRIINRRERWAKWTAVGLVIGVPLLYVASFGPACWIDSRIKRNSFEYEFDFLQFYRPVEHVWLRGPDSVAAAINWYCYAFTKPDWEWKPLAVRGQPYMGNYEFRFAPLSVQRRVGH
jgi:hypothetical protein